MGDWYDHLHTAEDIARTREVLMAWIKGTGNADAGARMAEQTTARAVVLRAGRLRARAVPGAWKPAGGWTRRRGGNLPGGGALAR